MMQFSLKILILTLFAHQSDALLRLIPKKSQSFSKVLSTRGGNLADGGKSTEPNDDVSKASKGREGEPQESVDEQLLDVDDLTIDEDSSANVDRMEYADAYDDEEAEDLDYGISVSGGETSPPEDAAVEEQAADIVAQELEGTPTIELASEITPEMETIMLNELNYRRSDLKVIRPEIASIVVAKNVRRPVEGLPSNWYKEGMEPTEATRAIRKAALTVAIFGALAVISSAGSKAEFDLSKIKSRLPTSLPFLKPSGTSSAVSARPQKQSVAVVAAVEEEKEEPDHSVRPGQTPDPEPSDESFLDKIITAIVKRLRALVGR